MQEFFMDYGLWLLVALLVVVGLMVLLTGKRKDAHPATGAAIAPPAVMAAPVAPADPVAPPSSAIVDPDIAAVAEPVPASPSIAGLAEEPDDLLRMKGVGPKLRAVLIGLGVTRYAQIAAWSDGDIATIDAQLGNFKGRPVRDQWVDQAKYLAAGDVAGFEAKYGKL